MRAALEATRIVDEDSGDTLNKGAKSAALSLFEGTKQRFFAQLLLSMKLPSLLPAIDAALGEGHAVVVQLVSTAEAMLDRRLADLSPEEREALEIDLSPREYVVDYLARSFPVRLMQVFIDENGNARSEPMSDSAGNPVLCRSALAARERMIEQLCALPPIATALDAIIERFGVEAVAEVTGRSRRLAAPNSRRASRRPRRAIWRRARSGSSRAASSPRPRSRNARWAGSRSRCVLRKPRNAIRARIPGYRTAWARRTDRQRRTISRRKP